MRDVLLAFPVPRLEYASMGRRPTEARRGPSLQGVPRLEGRIQPPVAVILGAPAATAALVAELPTRDVTCYQMDLYQADRLREELAQLGQGEQVVTAPDLWDLPPHFETVVYPAPRGGERILKLDMLEQAYHGLRPGGHFIVLSPFPSDDFFPAALKKAFGRAHNTPHAGGTLFWCRREGDRPRRRHEVTFQARVGDDTLRFLSRPGTFSYGRLDEGARALLEAAEIEPGDRVLDLGCGCGTNGCFAARRGAAPRGRQLSLAVLSEPAPPGVTFVDSNVRAVALAALNARANGVPSFETVASSGLAELSDTRFDVVLANPPYYAQDSIARLFTERGLALLRRGGRFYLVTKQAGRIGSQVAETFGEVEVVARRGYEVFVAVR